MKAGSSMRSIINGAIAHSRRYADSVDSRATSGEIDLGGVEAEYDDARQDFALKNVEYSGATRHSSALDLGYGHEAGSGLRIGKPEETVMESLSPARRIRDPSGVYSVATSPRIEILEQTGTEPEDEPSIRGGASPAMPADLARARAIIEARGAEERDPRAVGRPSDIDYFSRRFGIEKTAEAFRGLKESGKVKPEQGRHARQTDMERLERVIAKLEKEERRRR